MLVVPARPVSACVCIVERRDATWLAQQVQAGAVFTQRQRWRLDQITDVIATSAGISANDLDNALFAERGGVDGAVARRPRDDVGTYLEALNAELTACGAPPSCRPAAS